ncbi:MAG: DNA damage-inducible protein D [Pseudomonadota bacterium]
MSHALEKSEEYGHTMERLESLKRISGSGSEYWFAREIQPILGYDKWQNFENVMRRAEDAMRGTGIDPSHHLTEISKQSEAGNGASQTVKDFFLSRGACYLIAMNGNPHKPEIAAAQAYFAAQTRARELENQQSEDEKRIEEREKVRDSFKAASGAAQDAGVSGKRQPLFHNARYEGLYGLTSTEYRKAKGVGKDNPFDRMGRLELSANDFQMNLAAEKLNKDGIKGEAAAISANKAVAERVRRTMLDSGVTPEHLPIEEPIKNVVKRVEAEKKSKALSRPNA